MRLLFPAPDVTDNAWAKATFPDWEADDRHHTEIVEKDEQSVLLKRVLDDDSYQVSWDDDSYQVSWHWEQGNWKQTDRHEFTLSSDGECLPNYLLPYHSLLKILLM